MPSDILYDSDTKFMEQALALAEKGRYSAAPNPCVGCVLVRDGKVIGEGWHERAGLPHAEVNALAATEQAKGCTAYVTLEPCSHTGRTPPCADALITAKVARVVVAMEDPNPLVAGQGIQRLRDAGIEVQVGVLETPARQLNRGFISRMTRQRPWVRLKLASSLDGKIALANGISQWITSTAARADVHRWRARSQAILSTATTVLADAARLTARCPEVQQQPLRVILDKGNELTAEHPIVQEPYPILLIRTVATTATDGFPEHVEIQVVPLTKRRRFDLALILSRLAERGINEVWTECGASLAGDLMTAGLVDELVLYLAPKLLGHHSRNLIELPNYLALAETAQLKINEIEQFGPDIRIVATIDEAEHSG